MQNTDTTEIRITAANVDLTNCAKEQVHIPNSIQPHGVLLILDPENFEIIQVSQNIKVMIGVEAGMLIGSPLSDLLDKTNIKQIQDCLNHDFIAVNPLRFAVNNKLFNIIVHEHQGFLYLEFEPAEETNDNDFMSFYQLTRKAIDDISSSDSLEELSNAIVQNISQITGFDRVLVYRFNADESGEIIAEKKQEELDSFLGLRYPATDVSPPARKLYKLNHIRIIPSVDYEAVELPEHPVTQEPFDLTYVTLKSVSPIHTEYLKNMGVQASMSISLMNDGELWGLIACHHTTPRYLPYETRSACEFLGKVMSIKLIEREHLELQKYQLEIKEKFSVLSQQISQSISISLCLLENIQLLSTLIASGGIAVCLEDRLALFGETPTQAQICDLSMWLRQESYQDIFQTDHLSKEYPPAADFAAIASGVFVLQLSRIDNSYIMWFRPEITQTVSWGGNPNKQAQVETDGSLTLTPRKSFTLWQETIKGQSLPWQKFELQQIIEVRNLLVEIIFKSSDKLVELNLELKRSNDELDAFAYIASHDLKEPLRGIYNYSYLLLEDYEEQLEEDGVRKLNTLMVLTKRMEKLIDALLRYSRLGRQELVIQAINLEDLILDDIKLVLEASQQEFLDIRIQKDMATFTADQTLIEEVFMNLIGNGLKYNTSDKKWVEVGCINDPEQSSQSIFFVRDNGIGIDESHQDLVFRIFKRLHGQKKYGGGTGAGLTIVKKIIERHGGRIWVESKLGQGTTFFFTLAGE
ncbi:MAG: ATP-binding protein [Limnothrix sp.]